MSLLKRFKYIFQAKANKVANEIEDPTETIDLAIEKFTSMQNQARAQVVSVAEQRVNREREANDLKAKLEHLLNQAQEAETQGNQELVLKVLQRVEETNFKLSEVQKSAQVMRQQQDSLEARVKSSEEKKRALETKRGNLKAEYAAAKAAVSINEALTGINEEASDIALMITRAEDKTKTLSARAQATDEMIASGALQDVTGIEVDDIQKELNANSGNGSNKQLDSLKAKYGIGNPKAIESTTGNGR